MKDIPTSLQDHLNSGSTTMCYCWKITRKDGVVMGFTEHDSNITFNGVTYEAEGGFTASAAQQALGLSVDNMELVGAFSSERIAERDLVSGVYDDAEVIMYWVNWADPTQFIISMSGSIGEVTQNGIQFKVELRGLTHRLNQKLGRVYQRTCDAVFGDSRCGLNVDNFTETGTVISVETNGVFVTDNLTRIGDYYSRGLLTWLTGNNSNSTSDIRTHSKIANNSTLHLWTPAVAGISVGDTFKVIAGCKQTLDVCKEKFRNVQNFQGFPHMPGKDIVTVYPGRGEANQEGGAIVT